LPPLFFNYVAKSFKLEIPIEGTTVISNEKANKIHSTPKHHSHNSKNKNRSSINPYRTGLHFLVVYHTHRSHYKEFQASKRPLRYTISGTPQCNYKKIYFLKYFFSNFKKYLKIQKSDVTLMWH